MMRFPLLVLCLASLLQAAPELKAPRIPFSFAANHGQSSPDVRFIARGEGYAVLLRQNDALMRVGADSRSVRMSLPNSAGASSIEALSPQAQVSNYLIGNNSADWKRHIPHYSRVRYRSVYPGIDLVYHSLEAQLEYDFVLAPGASAKQIEMQFDGAEQLEILPNGDLALRIGKQTLTNKAPIAYQEIGGQRRPVKASYVRRGASAIGFSLGHYDPSLPLVIDPVLVYSTYLGGNRADYVTGIAVDREGAVYVTGQTVSLDFPTKGTNLTPYQGAVSYGFISKFAPGGGSLIYSTIIGGASNTTPAAITVDDEGNAYVTGKTGARNFPLANPVQSNQLGLNIGFVLKLNAKGDQLLFSTYHGGERNDNFNAIAIDKQKNIYVTGYTTSTTFPLVNAWQQQMGGASQDMFVAKYTAPNYRLAYSSYFGGTAVEEGLGIVADERGAAYVTGATRSPNFATPGTYQTKYGGTEDAFVAKIRPAGGVDYFTYVGGGADDIGRAIALDAAGNIWIAGSTLSTNLPTTVDALQASLRGNCDAFFAQVSPDGTQLLFSSYYGGSSRTGSTYNEGAQALAIDAAGALHLAGVTRASDFPVTRPLQSYGGGDTDAFLLKFNPHTREVDYSFPFGGSGNEEANAIAVDAAGGVYFAGETFSTNFPLKAAFRSTFGASSEGFLTKVCDPILLASAGSLTFFQTVNGAAPAAQNLKISACADIAFQVEVSGDFLRATPGSGKTDATLAVSVDGRNLPIGDYDGKLTIISAEAKNNTLVIPVRLRVNPPPPQISASGIVNAASSKGGPVAPGELIVIYGVNLGPAQLVGFSVSNGLFANELASTRVFFNGIPAPLVYSSAGQVSAIVPYGVAGLNTVQVEVEYRGVRSNPVNMGVALASPALFTLNASGSGPGAILNQDYTVNTAANPAERGATVILYATGEGLTNPAGADGQVVSDVLARPRQTVKVSIGGVDAIVDYAGSAPGLVAGVFQINARIPANVAAGNQAVVLSVGSISSPGGVTVSVK